MCMMIAAGLADVKVKLTMTANGLEEGTYIRELLGLGQDRLFESLTGPGAEDLKNTADVLSMI